MTNPTALPCATCGYDLRMQPREGICPECATPVEKAIELAAIPLRPAWRDSDPRWRRRMLAGAWVMVLVPLVAALQAFGLASRVPVPLYEFRGFSVATLETSFLIFVYPYLAFCTGAVLFFSKERFRQRHPLDWTRRWGVFVSYLVLLLGIPVHALLVSLVLVGIGALFVSLPPENQPAVTGLVIELGAGYLLYGPNDSGAAYVTAAAFSACAVLLSCVPIYNALRSSGPKTGALVILGPLGLSALAHIAFCALLFLNSPLNPDESPPPFFFEPYVLLAAFGNSNLIMQTSLRFDLFREAAKWLPFLAIAIWLSIAQVRAWRESPTREPNAP